MSKIKQILGVNWVWCVRRCHLCDQSNYEDFSPLNISQPTLIVIMKWLWLALTATQWLSDRPRKITAQSAHTEVNTMRCAPNFMWPSTTENMVFHGQTSVFKPHFTLCNAKLGYSGVRCSATGLQSCGHTVWSDESSLSFCQWRVCVGICLTELCQVWSCCRVDYGVLKSWMGEFDVEKTWLICTELGPGPERTLLGEIRVKKTNQTVLSNIVINERLEQ